MHIRMMKNRSTLRNNKKFLLERRGIFPFSCSFSLWKTNVGNSLKIKNLLLFFPKKNRKNFSLSRAAQKHHVRCIFTCARLVHSMTSLEKFPHQYKWKRVCIGEGKWSIFFSLKVVFVCVCECTCGMKCNVTKHVGRRGAQTEFISFGVATR